MADPPRHLTLLRHTQNDGDRLTAEGVRAARALGSQFAADEFVVVVVSGAQRTAQTAACLLSAGHLTVPGGVVVHDGFGSALWPRWDAAIARLDDVPHIEALATVDPELIATTAARLEAAVGWTRGLLDGSGNALVVSHSPLIELALWRLTGNPPAAPLGRGHWVEVPI